MTMEIGRWPYMHAEEILENKESWGLEKETEFD